MESKVLVASPVYSGMDYCFKDFIEHLKKVDYNNFDILIVDNSRTKEFFEKIKNMSGIKVVYDNIDDQKNMGRIISSRNKILEYAKDNNYDYLLMMDCDVMVPPNIIKRLISCQKEVVSGLYFNYFKCDGKIQLLPVAYKALTDEEFDEIKGHIKLPRFVKTKTDLRVRVSRDDIERGEIAEVIIPSNGCTLLSRKAFTSGAKYGQLILENGHHTTDDIFFFNELKNSGFKMFCDTNLICKHAVDGKRNVEGLHPAYE